LNSFTSAIHLLSFDFAVNSFSSSERDSLQVSTSEFFLSSFKFKSTKSNQIMGWPFCPSCRATLRVDAPGSIECSVCPYRSNLSEMSNSLPESTTYSADRAVPLWAKSDEEQAALKRTSAPVRATIEEPCIKCSHPEVGYYTVQLRSVDEGQTVFYECPNCKYTWSVNN
jgi:DNA-directed RNA polymerase I subunit RPA12